MLVEPNDKGDDRIRRVAGAKNVLPVAVSIDDVLGNEDFDERMEDGVENDDIPFFLTIARVVNDTLK